MKQTGIMDPHKLNVILLESNENTTTILTQKGVTITN